MIFTPFPLESPLSAEVTLYSNYTELEKRDYRFKLLFNFTREKGLNKFFSPIQIADIPSLAKEASTKEDAPLSDLLQGALLHAR